MDKKTLTLIIFAIFIIGLVAYRYVLPMFFYMPIFLNVSPEIEKTCVLSGGEIVKKRCCGNFDNYPVYYAGDQMPDRFKLNNSCSCADGHVIKYCDCSNAGNSFDGKKCTFDNRCAANGICIPL